MYYIYMRHESGWSHVSHSYTYSYSYSYSFYGKL